MFGGMTILIFFICLCVVCCKHASGWNKTSGEVYSSPSRNTLWVVLSTRNRTAEVASNVNGTKTNTELTDCPPAYSTIDKPIYNIQKEMKTMQFNGSLQNYGYLPQSKIRAPSAPKLHTCTSPSRKPRTTFIV